LRWLLQAHRKQIIRLPDLLAGPHLQDQLLLPFALAGGGTFTSVNLSEHTRTAARIIERFTGRSVRFGSAPNGVSQMVEVR
jgi:RNA 3'-terminal phosphate cyclase (ATP)